MCIIAMSPAGKDLPDEATIRRMFAKNPDGAGFAIQGDFDGAFKVKYHKGFMDVDSFLKALGDRDKLKDYTVAMHFRIKTSGNIDQSTTHPFLMSDQYSDLRKLDGEGAVLFHNGVLSGLGGIINEHSSDTQDYVVGVAMRYMRHARKPGAISQKVVEQITGMSRILILYPKRSYPMIMLGSWTEDNGNFYSNTGYKEVAYSYSGYYSSHAVATVKQSAAANEWDQLDEWGCQIGKWSRPGKDGWWKAPNKERFNAILEQAQERGIRAGYDSCTFLSTKDTVWYIDEENLELYTAAREEDWMLKRQEEDFVYQTGFEPEDGYILFDDEDMLMEWMEIGKRVSDYEVIYAKQHWYIDTVNLEAYSEVGIKKYFKTGEQGHIRKWLSKDGTLIEHQNIMPDFDKIYEQNDEEVKELRKEIRA